jgi:hypothetical protein
MLKMFVLWKKNARFVNCLTSEQSARQKTGTEQPHVAELLQSGYEGRKFSRSLRLKNLQQSPNAKNLAVRAAFQALRSCHLGKVLENLHTVAISAARPSSTGMNGKNAADSRHLALGAGTSVTARGRQRLTWDLV